jgi:hypothetical protein
MSDTSNIPETQLVIPAAGFDNKYLRSFGSFDPTQNEESSFTKIFKAATIPATASVLEKYGLTDETFSNLTDGQKRTITTEIWMEADASLSGSNGLRKDGDTWVKAEDYGETQQEPEEFNDIQKLENKYGSFTEVNAFIENLTQMKVASDRIGATKDTKR